MPAVAYCCITPHMIRYNSQYSMWSFVSFITTFCDACTFAAGMCSPFLCCGQCPLSCVANAVASARGLRVASACRHLWPVPAVTCGQCPPSRVASARRHVWPVPAATCGQCPPSRVASARRHVWPVPAVTCGQCPPSRVASARRHVWQVPAVTCGKCPPSRVASARRHAWPVSAVTCGQCLRTEHVFCLGQLQMQPQTVRSICNRDTCWQP